MARKEKAVAEPVELEEVQSGGLGIDEGIVLATFFVLVGAIVMVYFASQGYQ